MVAVAAITNIVTHIPHMDQWAAASHPKRFIRLRAPIITRKSHTLLLSNFNSADWFNLPEDYYTIQKWGMGKQNVQQLCWCSIVPLSIKLEGRKGFFNMLVDPILMIWEKRKVSRLKEVRETRKWSNLREVRVTRKVSKLRTLKKTRKVRNLRRERRGEIFPPSHRIEMKAKEALSQSRCSKDLVASY